MTTNALESILTETIVDGKQAVGDAVNWALKQAPDLCEQYLRWEFVSSVLFAALCFVGLLILAAIIRACCKSISHLEDEPGKCMAIIFAGAGAVFLTVGLLVNSTNALKVHIAPKVYLVEFAAKLIKR